MTHNKPCRLLMQSHHCRARGDARGVVRTAFSETAEYDAGYIRDGLRARHVLPLLARRNTEHGSGLGQCRW